MKMNPPKLVIDEKEPFKDALFGREEFAKSLTNLLRSVSENLVVFVNAPWGEGKTTFSQMWRTHLKQQKLDVIYFDAYAADYFEDPFVSFSGEILELVDKRLSEGKGLIERREFKETAIDVGKRLAGLATKIGLRAATLGAIEAAHVEELKKIGAEIASGVSEAGAHMVEKKLEDHGKEKKALKKFKDSLTKLAAKVREEQGFPLTIIVDELDRCRPDFALGLLERIKHLFDVEGVAFVLLVNRAQIESYIQTIYGSGDAGAYLLKFGSLFVDLPCQQQASNSYQYVRGGNEYCNTLFDHYGLAKKVPDGRHLVNCTAIFAKHFDLSLREIEKVFAVMVIYYGSEFGNQRTFPFLIAMLSVLKIKRPSVYQALSKAALNPAQFFLEVNWNQIDLSSGDNLSLEWATNVLDCCLMSDAEFESATDDKNPKARPDLGQMKTHFRRDRNRTIPSLCAQLDRFSLSPN